MREKFRLWWQKFSEAWTACALTMVQGDLSVFSINHAQVAAKTGLGAATAVVLTSLILQMPNRWAMAWLTGICVMLVDICIHPTHFGEHWHEAFVTGLGALMLSGILYRKEK